LWDAVPARRADPGRRAGSLSLLLGQQAAVHADNKMAKLKAKKASQGIHTERERERERKRKRKRGREKEREREREREGERLCGTESMPGDPSCLTPLSEWPRGQQGGGA